MSEIQVFAAPQFQTYPDFKAIVKDFKKYKQTNKTEFDNFKFGKDVSYNRPWSAVAAELHHIHLVPIKSRDNTSDRFLVYSRGYLDPNAYVVLAIFEPDAHAISRNTLIMSQMAELAEAFRSQY